MKIFLCHTPLHIFICSSIIASSDGSDTCVVVIEDSEELHILAISIFAEKNISLKLLPGTASGKNSFHKAVIQRKNSLDLQRSLSEFASRIYLFHDLRAESQIFLNSPICKKNDVKFILLEDGIALYPPRGELVNGLLSIAKRKLFFSWKWRHAKELGLHPALSEVHAFFPDLLRHNLSHLEKHQLPKWKFDILDAYNNDFNSNYAIIAPPHFRSVDICFLKEFIKSSLKYCDEKNVTPYFKIHPRDSAGKTFIKSLYGSSKFTQQTIPLECFLLLKNPPSIFIASRTSSLHIAKFLAPDVDIRFYEDRQSEVSMSWEKFLVQTKIQPLAYS